MDAHKILWHEGMFLSPQHFQHAERHADRRLAQVVRALSPHSWGLSQLTIDRRALAAGEFALLAAEGIMPDGLAFSLLAADELPASRPVAPHLDTRRDRCGMHLAVPSHRPGGLASSDNGEIDGRHTRFRRRIAELADENPGGNPRQLALAAVNLRVLFDGEPLDGHTTLKIAEVVRNAAGGYEIADDCVPPVLTLAAAPNLIACVRRMAEILVGRSSEMAQQRRSRTHGLVEFSVSEIATFLMLHTINGQIPPLLHALARPQVHPETVFLQLASLAGHLCTFSDAGHPKDVPDYLHEQPMASFKALEARLRGLLQTVIPTRYTPIPLTAQSERVQSGTIPEQVLEGARIYLAVHTTMPADRVLREVPLKAKVASAGRIAAITAQAMPGIRLTYLSVPPSEIPTQPGGTYFELDPTSPEWAAAIKTRSLAIYLPPEFSEARTEFLAVKE